MIPSDWEDWTGTEGWPLWINPAVERMTGYTVEECLAMPGYPLPLIHEEDREAVAAALRSMAQGGRFNELTFRVRRKDGAALWVSASAQPIYNDEGAWLGHRSSIRDITDRKRAEEALRASEARYRALVEQIPGVIYRAALDASSTTSYVSPQIERFIGRSPAEYSADPDLWRKLLHPDDRERVMAEVARSHATGATFCSEYRMIARDGRVVWFRDEAQVVCDDSGRPLCLQGVMVDITDRKRAEEKARLQLAELAHVLRVGTMGEMAAGLAHELNQPLTAISNYLRGCLRRLQSGGADMQALMQTLEKAAAQAERAGEIVHSVRSFIRKEEPRRMPVELNDIVREAMRIVSPEAHRQRVAVRLALCERALMVLANPVELEQVILNLTRNAIEAMVPTESATREVRIETAPAGDGFVETSVCDTGPGVPPDQRDKPFDPFFTTKADGLGLGLSISRSIVEAYRGRLWMTPNRGPGCTFRFTLPVMTDRS